MKSAIFNACAPTGQVPISRRNTGSLLFRLGVVVLAALLPLAAQSFKPLLGVEVDRLDDSSRARPFVNHAKLFRPCTAIDGSDLVPVDADGWPASDAECVMFDVRPFPAWSPPIDDPAQFQPDWSGVWSVSLQGRAEVSAFSDGTTINGLAYDEATNLTSASVNVQPGSGLLILAFRHTHRTPDSGDGSGFRALRLIRPGYPAGSRQIFTDEFLRAFGPFQILRYMDFASTNSVTPSANVADLLEWTDRHVPGDATQQAYGRKAGAAWEYAVLLANQTGTDMWINIPVSASTDYIRQLARLVATGLNPGLRVYIEHGNEVWNPLFANSYNYNHNAAAAEVTAGGSNLNNDHQPPDSIDIFARRRHLRGVLDAVRIFREEQAAVGGPAEAPGDFDHWRVRGIFAWWTIHPDEYQQALDWGQATYGPMNQFIYAIASTHYYNVLGATATDSPERLVEVMTANSDAGVNGDNQLRQIAAHFGLRHTIYEGGPDVGGGSTVNVGNRILANRLPAMRDLVIHDAKTNWFDHGAFEYNYFSHCGACSRYGCWGATEDIVNLNTPKLNGLGALSGTPPVPSVSAIVNGASFQPSIAPGSFASVIGGNLARLTHEWGDAILDGYALPTMLGGFQVRFNGEAAAVAYVGAQQANVIVPPDLPPGTTQVEVYSQGGIWKGTVELQTLAPAWFGNSSGGKFYAAVGHSPHPGDVVELYAAGLGPTALPVPVNEAPHQAYPLADPASVHVTIGGRTAQVLFAGITLAGAYQVNVRVPVDVPAGDQPLELHVGTQVAPPAYLTVR